VAAVYVTAQGPRAGSVARSGDQVAAGTLTMESTLSAGAAPGARASSGTKASAMDHGAGQPGNGFGRQEDEVEPNEG
jgi:hypothetical protein